jgi:cardiolipin synthase
MRLIVAILIFATALLGYVVWGKSRRRPVEFVIPEGEGLEGIMRAMAAYTWGRIIEGNRVVLVQNSAFFDALLEDVAAARNHVHLETYLWHDGAVSERVAEALSSCAARGVAVRVLVDQQGGKRTSPRVWARMRAAGCDFRVFHRLRPGEFAWYNHRDHRKIAVIDGRVAYTFGHGIADMWGPSADNPYGWRDTAARIEGPAVGEMQAAFFDNWLRTGGAALLGADLFPPLRPAGEVPLHVAYLSPRETTSAVHRLYHMAIAAAREEIVIQNPYFLPASQSLELFAAARARGVRVEVMLPTSDASDFSLVQHASHFYYGPLLDLGVRVYEYKRGMHQKVMIVDRLWFSVGSTNFDPRSFRLNNEITVAMCDRALAAELRAAFEEDLRQAEEWTPERWRSRSVGHRVNDRWSALFKRWL